MSASTRSHLTRLAFSIYENRGVYAFLIGSGVSRASGIPTGWEITLDLIRRISVAQGVKELPDPIAWYRETAGKEPSYSEIVAELGLLPEERRSILHSYIEPTMEDRQEGRKLPSTAHYAIADLVKAGYVRVIITTNFDRLLENALREREIEPTVIHSVDTLKGAEPLAHTKCYLFKIHGDYKDARILNTENELSNYPPEYDVILDQIFEEYGLVVCGWSGEWDSALRAAILRNNSRRYSMFWATRGQLNDRSNELIIHRQAHLVSITDSDSFFANVRDQVETIAQTHRQSPQDTDLLVNSTKRYLSKPEYRIQLEELFTKEARSLLENIDAAEFSVQGQWSAEEFRRRIAVYEAIVEPLARMVGVLGRWSTGSELSMLMDIIQTIDNGTFRGSGLVAWVELRSYPAVLLVTAYGLGLVRAQRWDTLHEFLSYPIERKNGMEYERVVEEKFSESWSGNENDFWRALEGCENKKTALSDHLCQVYSAWSECFVGLVPKFEVLYETWEIIASITYCERYDVDHFAAKSSSDDLRLRSWMPIGRSQWNRTVRQVVLERIKSKDLRQALLDAGFGMGNRDFLDGAISSFEKIVWHRW